MSGGSNETQLWHKRFGHVNYRDLKHSLSKDLNEVDENCETCCLAKITKTPVPKRNENKASKAHERVVSDVVGPITPSSKDGYRYFVTFIDEYSSHACVKFIRHKSEVLQKFKEYIAECGTPQILRSDNGTEYTNKNFKNYCTNNKVKQEYTVPETPEQNGVAERYNRTVVETARSPLIESKLPKCYWLRAVDTAAYVRNLVKRDKNEKNPYEKFWGRKPKTDHLKVFGCLAYVKNRNREKSKFDPKARKHVFLGYDGNSTAYLLQDVETRKLTRARNVVFNEKKVVGFSNESREDENSDLLFDVTFEDEMEEGKVDKIVKVEVKNEQPEFEIKRENSSDEGNSSVDESENQFQTLETVPLNPEIEVRHASPGPSERTIEPRPSKIPVLQARTSRTSDVPQTSQGKASKPKPPSRLQIAGQYLKTAIPSSEEVLDERWDKYLDMKDARKQAKTLKREKRSRNPPQRYGESYSHNTTYSPKDPETYNEALSSSDRDKWQEAMQTELQCLQETKTWNLVERPSQKNVIPGKWVYKVKTKADGSIEKYKARYVAKNFKQIEGIDYSETFAPTSKPETFLIILSLAAKENFTLRQMDVKLAYLHPEIKEEIYLEQPTGFEKLDSSGKKLVCKLNKSIYGLKQAAKNWYEELANFLIQQKFTRSRNDYCLFSKIENNEKLYVLSWVDDLVIAGSNNESIELLKKLLKESLKWTIEEISNGS